MLLAASSYRILKRIFAIMPPSKVLDALDRVINAEVTRKKVLNQAQGYRNRIVPRRGQPPARWSRKG